VYATGDSGGTRAEGTRQQAGRGAGRGQGGGVLGGGGRGVTGSGVRGRSGAVYLELLLPPRKEGETPPPKKKENLQENENLHGTGILQGQETDRENPTLRRVEIAASSEEMEALRKRNEAAVGGMVEELSDLFDVLYAAEVKRREEDRAELEAFRRCAWRVEKNKEGEKEGGKEGGKKGTPNSAAGTQLTCFTSTNVRILTRSQ
jgi:hypothetical protein